jgi:hypothetical protein
MRLIIPLSLLTVFLIMIIPISQGVYVYTPAWNGSAGEIYESNNLHYFIPDINNTTIYLNLYPNEVYFFYNLTLYNIQIDIYDSYSDIHLLYIGDQPKSTTNTSAIAYFQYSNMSSLELINNLNNLTVYINNQFIFNINYTASQIYIYAIDYPSQFIFQSWVAENQNNPYTYMNDLTSGVLIIFIMVSFMGIIAMIFYFIQKSKE